MHATGCRERNAIKRIWRWCRGCVMTPVTFGTFVAMGILRKMFAIFRTKRGVFLTKYRFCKKKIDLYNIKEIQNYIDIIWNIFVLCILILS